MLSKKHAKKPAYLPRFIEQATVPEILKSTCFEGDWLPLQSAAAQLVEHFAPRIPNSLSLSRSLLPPYLSMCHLPTYLPIGLSLSLFLSIPGLLSLSLSLFFPLSLCLSIYPSVFLNCLSVHLSVCIYIYTHTHISMY